jgi:hypothetical protein
VEEMRIYIRPVIGQHLKTGQMFTKHLI